MKKTTIICIVSLLTIFSFPADISAQTYSDFKDLNLHTGLSIICPPSDLGFVCGLYIAPSMRYQKHEFIIGPLIAAQIYNSNFNPYGGCVVGYRYYFFKKPMRVNMFLHEFFQFYNMGGTDSYHGTQTYWHEENYHNVVGIGFHVFIDKKRRYSFYNTLGYGLTISQSHYKPPIVSYYRYNFLQIDINFGFCFKLASIDKKSEN
jgi:hypothetical protein